MKRAAFLVALCCASASAQTENTFYVKQFSGSTVGQKVANAAASCVATVPCIVIVDPTLATYPTGTMPSLAANVVLLDYRAGSPYLLPTVTGPFTLANNAIDVRTYGAKCDGATDDSAAFMSAIAAANSSTAMVEIPSGTCLVNLTVGPSLGFTLEGRGVYATSLSPYANAPVITINSGVTPGDGVQNLAFRHFGINNAGDFTSNAILMYGSPQNVRKLFDDIAISASGPPFTNPILNRGFSIWDTFNRVNVYKSAGDAIVYSPGANVSLTGFSITTTGGVSTVTFTDGGKNGLLPGTQFDVTGFSTGAGTALNHVFFVVTSAGMSSFQAETALCLYNGSKCKLTNTGQVTDGGTAHPEAFFGGLTFERSTVKGATGRCLYISTDITDNDSAPFSSGLQNIAFKDGDLEGCQQGGAEIDNLTVAGEISNTDFENNGMAGSNPYNNLTLGGSYTRGLEIHGSDFVTPNGTGGASIDIESTTAWGISVQGNLIWAPSSGYTVKVNGRNVNGSSSGSGVWIGANQEFGSRSITCDAKGFCMASGSSPFMAATNSYDSSTFVASPNVSNVSHLDFYNIGAKTVTGFTGGDPGQHVWVSMEGTGTLAFSGSSFSLPNGIFQLKGGQATEFWMDSNGRWFPLTAYETVNTQNSGSAGAGVCWKTATTLGACTAGTWPNCTKCD